MRTTIKLDEDAGEIVQLYARGHGISISKAISNLVLEAANPKMRTQYEDGIPVFDIPQGRIILDEEIRAALAEEF